MKKISLFLSALLVSLSVLAGPLGNIRTCVRPQVNKQEECKRVATTSIEKFVTAPSIQVKNTESAAVRINKMPQREAAAQSIIKAEEVGYGIASIDITPADGADTLYYQIAILDSEYNLLASIQYFQLSMITQYIDNTYDLIKTAAQLSSSSNKGYLDPSITSLNLPKGEYIVALLGYPVVGSQLAEKPVDVAMAQFAITLDGTEYAVKNVQATLGENNRLTITWENAAEQLPEGAAYQVRIYTVPDGKVVANSGYDLQTTTWTTPDTITLAENTSYEIIVYIWAESGYSLGKSASLYYVIGVDPNAPTNLAVNVNEETMKATFTWKNSITEYQVDDTTKLKVYNEVIILDEKGNIYIFDNGYNNTSEETGTSEQLPVGKFTWKVMPFYYDGSFNTIAVVNGPDFTVEDKIAPVINSVAIASTSDTEVYLSIDVTDNALGVTAADLVFAVSGDITLADAKLEEDGTLKLSELTTKLYNISITATDPSNNTSEAFTFEFTPVKDEAAPTDLKAELDSVSDKFINVKVSATDDIATAEQLVYVFIFDENNRFEASTKDGNIHIDGLKPETEYSVKVTVKDFGGNVCKDTITLNFTTLELIPIIYNVKYAQTWMEGDYSDPSKGIFNYTFFMYNIDETTEKATAPIVTLDIYPKEKNLLSGVYSNANGNLEDKYSAFYPESYSRAGAKSMSDAQLTLKFIADEADEQGTYHIYYISAKWMGEDDNLYVVEGIFYLGVFDENDNWVNDLNAKEVFKDTDAPALWVSEDYPVEGYGTYAKIMFGVYDGPFYFEGEAYTEIEDLILEIQLADGTVLASQAEGTIENTPTLDEDGAYYFTATLKDLAPNTDYEVYIYAKDEAGNESERLKVNFNSGEVKEEAIDQVVFDIKANKVLRNGQLIIKRDKKAYNVLGAEL